MRGTNILIGLTIVLIFVVGLFVGIHLADSRVSDQEVEIGHLCFALDEAGSDSTDPIVLEACRP